MKNNTTSLSIGAACALMLATSSATAGTYMLISPFAGASMATSVLVINDTGYNARAG